jgi:hypothetical protein
VDDSHSCIIVDYANFEGLARSGRADEHRDLRIVGLEGSPVVSNCMQHVIVSDAVLAGCRLDVHATVYGQEYRSSTHVDDLCDEADRQMGTTVSARVGDAEDDRTHVS